MKNSKYFLALATLIATIIGGGIFALPYAFARSGFWPAIIIFGLMAVVGIIIMLMFGEVILRTKGTHHQSTGYAEIYLGKPGKFLMLLVNILGGYGGLLIYTIGVGDFLERLFSGLVPISEMWWGIIFFVVASVFVVMGIKKIAKLDFGILFVFIGIVATVFILAIPKWGMASFSYSNWSELLFPFGIIIFSLMGSSALPLLDDMLGKQKGKIKSVVIWGVIITAIISLFFALAVFGMGGAETTQDSLGTVQQFLPEYISILMGIFGIIAMGTSFLTTGVVLREVYEYDYKIKKFLALLLVLSIPLILFLLNIAGFAGAIGFVGSITGGLAAILFIIMYRRARKNSQREPEYQIKIPGFVQILLVIMYVVAMSYEVYSLL